MSVERERDAFAEQEFEDERRRDRLADYTPPPSGPTSFWIPVLLGGPSDGRAVDPGQSRIVVGETMYEPRKFGVSGSRWRVCFYAWQKFPRVESQAAAWEWLVRHAFDAPEL